MDDSAHPSPTSRTAHVLRWALALILAAISVGGFWLVYAYATTPEAIRHPASDHYHFRMQIVNNGTPINFADPTYQTPFDQDVCTAALTKEPAHFHDGLDQFVHVHWQHLNGGTLLKNYGWDFIAGTSRTLGYRFDKFPSLVRVPVHGKDLPEPPVGANYYVYVSSVNEPTNYWQQSWDDFLSLDLKDFFSIKPGFPPRESWLQRLTPSASAHNESSNRSEQELAELNDVLGNVVVFAQQDPPTDEQIKARFADLVPLPESSCGG